MGQTTGQEAEPDVRSRYERSPVDLGCANSPSIWVTDLGFRATHGAPEPEALTRMIAQLPESSSSSLFGRVRSHRWCDEDPLGDINEIRPPATGGIALVTRGTVRLVDPCTGDTVGYRGPGEIVPIDRNYEGRLVRGLWRTYPLTKTCQLAWLQIREPRARQGLRMVEANDLSGLASADFLDLLLARQEAELERFAAVAHAPATQRIVVHIGAIAVRATASCDARGSLGEPGVHPRIGVRQFANALGVCTEHLTHGLKWWRSRLEAERTLAAVDGYDC